MSEDIAWAAGILEGEGTFHAKGNSPRVFCEMTDEDVLIKLQSIFGGTITKQKLRNNWKQTWRWGVYGSNAQVAMELIRPYLLSRRSARVDEILSAWYDYLESRSKRSDLVLMAVDEYKNGNASLRTLAKKYGISYETIRRNAV